MPQIINGKEISAQIKEELKDKVKAMKEDGISVCLAVIQVGDDPASSVYVGNKKKACAYIGIASLAYELPEETTQEELLELIDVKIHETALQRGVWLEERKEMRKEIFRAMRRLDILPELIEDPGVTEIMINGKDHIFIERAGQLFRWENKFDSEEKLNAIIQQIVSGCNRVVNEASPIVDARLENGSRVNVVLKPAALNGPIVTIRRFPEKPMDMKNLVELGALQESHSIFLEKLVQAGYNILVSGGTGSGKTTFLNALSNFIPKDERVITIEDSAELQIRSIENLVRLETRNANVEGCRPITIRDLIKTALRMRPDRIIVGEVRGAEAAGNEYRPRWLSFNRTFQQCGGYAEQAGNNGTDGDGSAGIRNQTADRFRSRYYYTPGKTA